MSMRAMESAIVGELRRLTGVTKLRIKDMQEWTTGEITPRDDEHVFWLPLHRMHVAVRKVDLPAKASLAALVVPAPSLQTPTEKET